MQFNEITPLLSHREPLLRIAEKTHQAAGPKWSRDITEFFAEVAGDPERALGRERASAVMTIITNLLIAEGITIATGPAHAPRATMLSSPGFDTALAAMIDLLRAIKHQDATLARDLREQMHAQAGAFLAAVQDRIDAMPRPHQLG